MIKEVIVVEGVHDQARINQVYPDALVVITNGLDVNDKLIELLRQYQEKRGLILFFDPDSPGEKIRSLISERIEGVKHAFISSKVSRSKNGKKVGVEHASQEEIMASLSFLITETTASEALTTSDLMRLGLIGQRDSSFLRGLLSEYLNIGRPNSKTFLKRINMLGLSYSDLEEKINKVKSCPK